MTQTTDASEPTNASPEGSGGDLDLDLDAIRTGFAFTGRISKVEVQALLHEATRLRAEVRRLRARLKECEEFDPTNVDVPMPAPRKVERFRLVPIETTDEPSPS